MIVGTGASLAVDEKLSWIWNDR